MTQVLGAELGHGAARRVSETPRGRLIHQGGPKRHAYRDPRRFEMLATRSDRTGRCRAVSRAARAPGRARGERKAGNERVEGAGGRRDEGGESEVGYGIRRKRWRGKADLADDWAGWEREKEGPSWQKKVQRRRPRTTESHGGKGALSREQ